VREKRIGTILRELNADVILLQEVETTMMGAGVPPEDPVWCSALQVGEFEQNKERRNVILTFKLFEGLRLSNGPILASRVGSST
jgi:endonuclease/exonuclease/phosphatase family metal-dependent hydrolase